MDIIISNSDSRPIYEQITLQIKNQIIRGALQEGDALPSMRTLAKELRISVITTKRAYEDLERDGFIVTRAGKGSYVSAQNPHTVQQEYQRQIHALFTQAAHLAHAGAIPLSQLLEDITFIYEGESV